MQSRASNMNAESYGMRPLAWASAICAGRVSWWALLICQPRKRPVRNRQRTFFSWPLAYCHMMSTGVTRLHFSDHALMQHHSADQLHIEVTHLDGAPASLADHCKSFGQNLVQCGAFRDLDGFRVFQALKPGGNPLSEFDRFGP